MRVAPDLVDIQGGTLAGGGTVIGDVVLAGVLDIDLIDGFTPDAGQSFTIMTFGSRIGDFDSYSGLDLGGGLFLQPIFSATGLTLVAQQAVPEQPVPEPSTYLLLASGLGALGWWRRQSRARGDAGTST